MKVYLDNAATTSICPEALQRMNEFSKVNYGNPSSLHSWGRAAKEALEQSRLFISSSIGAEPTELIFTSSGTESDNLAVIGTAYQQKKGHIITSKIEHPAVLEPCKYLEKNGFDVSYIPVDKYGIVDISRLENEIREDTILISIMHANNEIGTIEPIQQIGSLAKKNDIVFHTDAVQTAGKIPLNVNKFNIDLLSMSSHKIHGPKGVGALYIRKGIKILPLFLGGGHEKGLRSSTENVVGIAGFSKAFEIAFNSREKNAKHMTILRDKLIKEIKQIDQTFLTGHPTARLPNNASFYFKGIEGESLILMLDDKGIGASTGSACSSTKLRASHVLLATGVKQEDAHGSLRFTLSRFTTPEEIEYVLHELPIIVSELRNISPLWNK